MIEYNRRSGVVAVTPFDGPNGHREAIDYRIERETAVPEEVEVVALVSDSLETIECTHFRYFARSA